MAKQLTKRMMEGGKGGMSGLLRCFPFHKKRAGFGAMTDAQLALHAHWCFEYAKANATGLRKILKKHDKLFHTAEGHRFLQVCPPAEPPLSHDIVQNGLYKANAFLEMKILRITDLPIYRLA